jgi:nitrogen regulatory protein P-II 1
MKMITAYIRHEAFEPIRAELLERGIPSLSIGEVKGSGRQKGIVEHYRGSTLTVNVRPKLKLEIVVDDKEKSMVVETILKHARTGEIGDGKIFVVPVEEAVRIRTGEEGQDVLQAHTEAELPAEPTKRKNEGDTDRWKPSPNRVPAGTKRCGKWTRTGSSSFASGSPTSWGS